MSRSRNGDQSGRPRRFTRVLWLPLRPLAPLVERVALYASNKAYKPFFERGERIVAIDAELGKENLWLASDKAVYVVATASKTNEQLGRSDLTVRVPYTWITSFDEVDHGEFRERTMTFRDPDRGEYRTLTSWCDMKMGGGVAAAIRKHGSPAS